MDYIEYGLGTLLYRFRGFDKKLFSKNAAFRSHPDPTIIITSPDCGVSGSTLTHEYSMSGTSRFPRLEWTCDLPDVKEWMLIGEDPDAPIPISPTHFLCWRIPASSLQFGPDDIAALSNPVTGENEADTARLGRNINGSVYVGPGPPLGHGPHRYFFELVGLSERLDPAKMSAIPTRTELAGAIDGKVLAWGQWIGVYEKQRR